MEHTSENHERDALIKVGWWQQFIERTTLAFAAACSGVVLYFALFPSFYYMTWLVFGLILWAVVAIACLLQVVILQVIARWDRVKQPSSPANGLRFIVGMLVLLSLLVAFKAPLRASFLLAWPGLEEALEQRHDDPSQFAQFSRHYGSHYGIYRLWMSDRSCHHKDRVFFSFVDDGEAAIIYSESGIDDLCYNSGNKGRLFGNWYWMKED